ncbi:Alpha/Beta hydrolase protein [Xylaria venustula]|nr:Alpha/Beta hydrolase protein [Xylaria venustula]
MKRIGSERLPHSKGEENSLATPLPSNARPRCSTIREHFRNRRFIYFLLALALYCVSVFLTPFQDNSHDHPVKDGYTQEGTESWTEWLDIVPSEKLKWQPCFGIYGPGFQCARLTVPMDYSRPLNESDNHPKVHLALIMAPGAGRTQDPSTYGEAPLLLNPGGPGGSGVFFAQGRARSFQLLIGDQHDIIGFDPRGVGASTPKADCFASSNNPEGVLGRNVAYMNRLTWLFGGQGVGLTNSSDAALTTLNARARAVAKLCQQVDESEGDDSIFRHIGTPNSARDMLSIIQAWDEWKGSSEQLEAEHPVNELQNTNDDKTSETSLQGKLVYWGFSYGTFLGTTFASMFPDKVGRLVLDGVVHADHYVEPLWEGSIVDADAIWDRFFVYCAEAGDLCSFHRTGDGPEDIRKRFSETLSLLGKQPATVIIPDTNLPALITASDMKKSIFFAGLYSPVAGFPVVADLLNHAFNGKLGEIAQGTGMATFCGNLTLPAWPDDAMKGIACGDKRGKLNENITELQARFEKAASYSWFADVWFDADPNLGCNGWEIESRGPPMRWDDHPVHKPALIETNFPILFLSNTLDPVTPLGHALEMTRKFANASIVEQDGLGHCSLSCVSGCMIAHIRAYFNEGIVPPPPKFKSDSSSDGEWPTCQCFDKPWTSSTYETEDSLSKLSVNTGHIQAYDELRDQFSAFTLSHQLDHHNPLKAYLVERSGLARYYP